MLELIDFVFRSSIKGSVSDIAVIDLKSKKSIFESHVFKLVSQTLKKKLN